MNYKELSKVTDTAFNYTPQTNEELRRLVTSLVKERGIDADLNDIDVSAITDMNWMFSGLLFNGDISNWNVSNVTSMRGTFADSSFNGDISKWDVSNVTTMRNMFTNSEFNGDISKWDVSNVTDMASMFNGSKFNGDISNWNVSSVTNMYEMFSNSKFNGDISNWDVSKVIDMRRMFAGSKFNGDISNWNVSNMSEMYSKKRATRKSSNKSRGAKSGQLLYGATLKEWKDAGAEDRHGIGFEDGGYSFTADGLGQMGASMFEDAMSGFEKPESVEQWEEAHDMDRVASEYFESLNLEESDYTYYGGVICYFPEDEDEECTYEVLIPND